MFQEDDKVWKSTANPIIPRWQNACRRAGRMPVAALAGCLSPRWQDACRRAGRMPVAALAGCLSPRGQDARRRQACRPCCPAHSGRS
ncbi:hypothetical protein ELH21_11895 [Rhizobium leguminosarum]|nr:hypothetical protein ELH21_11895 [Rhizobium leguminosarum]